MLHSLANAILAQPGFLYLRAFAQVNTGWQGAEREEFARIQPG
jgi:hypothetical protein